MLYFATPGGYLMSFERAALYQEVKSVLLRPQTPVLAVTEHAMSIIARRPL